jgi:hypothetical protein
MFKLLGALVALYRSTPWPRAKPAAKAGIGASTVVRGESPRYSWCVIII